jgi:PAS domain S-box-containing protein
MNFRILRLTFWRDTLGFTPTFLLFLFALLGLPVVLLMTVRAQIQAESLENARAISEVMLQVRRYYNLNIVNRIQKAQGNTIVTENYHDTPGAIPLPATMSIEIARTLTEKIPNRPFDFNFVSDHPFKGRNRPALDTFQREALAAFRSNPDHEEFWREDRQLGSGGSLRLAIPVKMQAACVTCHNAHPDSTFKQWQVGDVRGIQDVSVRHLVSEGRFDNFILLGGYLIFFLGTMYAALAEYRRGNAELRRLNLAQETSRQQLERQGEQLQNQLEELLSKTAALDKAPFGIVMADPGKPDMPVIYVNEAFTRITGYSFEEIFSRNCRILQGPDTDPEAVSALRNAIEKRQSVETELVNYRRDGSVFQNRILLFPCFKDGQELIRWVACIYDATDLKLANEEKNRLASELQESMKLESLGLTIAGIAHDLNTPIGIALTASSHMNKAIEQMKGQALADSVQGETVAKWASSLERARNLVQGNLVKAADLVRSFKQTTADATRVEWRRIQLKAFLESLLVSVSPVMRRGQCEVTLYCPDQISLYTEPGSLSQVITNLVVNASVHAFEGRTDRRLEIRVKPQEQGVIIEVTDNGNGMAQEAVAKAFTPFYTTRRGQGGSGLGLFSARRVVNNTLGGQLSFESESGRGTTFRVELPLTPPSAVAGAKA